MLAGSGSGDGVRARLSTDCTQKLLFFREGGCEGRIPSHSPFGGGEVKPTPPRLAEPHQHHRELRQLLVL